MNAGDAALQLAYAPMHPDRRHGLSLDFDGPRNVLQAIWKGRVSMPDEAIAATRVPAHVRRFELHEAGITLIQQADSAYPSGLLDLANPPPVLFVRGTVPVQLAVAIVGTRKATGYGVRLAEAFGRALAADGRVVVSGLAKGIDAAAHRGVVAAGGVGVAVLGNGVDRWYPAVNRSLGQTLLESGAVISEYPPGTAPAPWRFPPRNRIIVGLAAVVLVVEAGMPGGAMITARLGLEENRHVFAVPGDIDRPGSVGCNLLIRDGAWPVLGVDDLREAVDRVIGPAPSPSATALADPLIEACDSAGTSIDELALRVDRPVPELLADLTVLELDGRILVSDGMVVPLVTA